jgi:hypothetical protein
MMSLHDHGIIDDENLSLEVSEFKINHNFMMKFAPQIYFDFCVIYIF